MDLTGYQVRDAGDLNGFIFSGGTIEPGGYTVINQMDASEASGPFEFDIVADGAIRLFDPQGTLVDTLDWNAGEAPEGASYGRYPDGGDAIGTLSTPTYGASNTPFILEGDTERTQEGGEGSNTESTTEGGASTGAMVSVNEVSALSANEGPDWIELYNSGTEPAELDGWSIQDSVGVEPFEFPEGTSLASGAFLYLERGAESSFDFDLEAEDAVLLVSASGDVISSLAWGVDEAPEGFTFGRSPDGSATTGTLATPTAGAPNSGLLSESTEGGQGTESGSDEGGAPVPQAIRISEVMFNPAVVEDNVGEWFEIYNAGTDVVDIRDLEFGDDSGEFVVIEAEEPLLLTPGNVAVLARSQDVAVNGGVIAVATVSFALGNGGDSVIIRLDGEEMDRLDYGDFDKEKGVSLQQDPDSLADLGTSGMEGLWCLATESYGDGDLGTPGTENTPCETSAGTSGGEEGGEMGAPTYGPPTTLLITEFMPNPSTDAADDADGEWIELTNIGSETVSLEGLSIGDNAGDVVFPAGLSIAAQDSIVIARSEDSNLNGGLPSVTFVAPNLALNNGSDAVILKDFDGTELDRIDYDDDAGWPVEAGVAIQLDPTLAQGQGENNDVGAWCGATQSYGAGDFGTPGAFNPPCGETEEGGGGSALGKIFINEIAVDQGDGTGWIELFNSGTQSVDLENWSLVSAGGSASVFASGTSIGGGSFLLIQQSESDSQGDLVFDFALTVDGSVKLLGSQGGLEDTLDWNTGDAPTTLTYGRYPDGASATATLSSPTPEAANAPFLDGNPEITDHVCDTQCGAGLIGDINCYCDAYCYGIGDCCNATGTQYADGCAGSTCSICLPPSPCCSAGSCGDSTCEACVCATNPSCCSGVWDASCSALAVEACAEACSCN